VLSQPTENEILIVRAFNAPKAAVFDAWSKPEHLRRWFPCASLTMPVCEVDFRVGGKWRRVLRDAAQGMDHATSGEFREIARPNRMVFTEVYEPVPGSDHLVTLTFEDGADGTTLFSQRFTHRSQENRDAHLKSGLENGLEATFTGLDELLAAEGIAANASAHP
jgi:uncharacterized protein YndB with AHSA1/START domain